MCKSSTVETPEQEEVVHDDGRSVIAGNHYETEDNLMAETPSDYYELPTTNTRAMRYERNWKASSETEMHIMKDLVV